jgi:hypothetical protein
MTYLTKKQLHEQFIEEFLRRLRTCCDETESEGADDRHAARPHPIC